MLGLRMFVLISVLGILVGCGSNPTVSKKMVIHPLKEGAGVQGSVQVAVNKVYLLQTARDTFYIFLDRTALSRFKQTGNVPFQHRYIGVAPGELIFVFALSEKDRYKTAKTPAEKVMLHLQQPQKVAIIVEDSKGQMHAFSNTRSFYEFLQHAQ